MVSPIIIPIVIVAIAGIAGYLVYKLALHDYFCNRSVNVTLLEYGISKTQSQIVREFHEFQGKSISDGEVARLVKYYRQRQPDKFLSMYDEIREKKTD
ncbi:MAG: hypothetical protein D9C04_07035 [Nitrosopumilus sp. B06]|nr:MAG: hypothetical protein D9C04_07035 [Nitrosopumilus sp. B06]